MARTLASLAAYLATADGAGIQIHQFIDSHIATTIDAGRRIGVDVSTAYPADGRIRVRVTESDGQPWVLTLRIPAWATGAQLTDPEGHRQPVAPGIVAVERPFVPGDEITLSLPLDPRWTVPDPRIDAVRGCVAVERGPIVMCAESVDLPGGRHVDLLRVDPSIPPRDHDGAVVVKASFLEPTDASWPYGDGSGDAIETATEPLDVPLIPYHQWANRGPSTMRVWLPHATANDHPQGTRSAR